MKKLVTAASAAACVVASPVMAQDTGDFSGFKAAIVAGYDNADFGSFLNGTEEFDLKNAEGLVYGINLGYDFQSGRLVYGVDLEAMDSAADVNDRFLGEIKLGRDLYAGGRIGFVVSKNALIYGKVGYSDARLRTVGFRGINLDGVRLGAGLEYKFTEKLFARAEYRRAKLGEGLIRNQGVAGLGFQF